MRAALVIHRWLGVSLCLLFLLWFPSGIVMMYWDFPSVSAAHRLERSPPLDPEKIFLTPTAAVAALGLSGPPDQARLTMFDGRPVYRLRFGRRESVVYADTGEQQTRVPTEMMERIVSAWTGQPASAAQVREIRDVDQWTVQGRVRDLVPLWKYSWPNGEQVYISQPTGEIVQYTTKAARFWAYLGAIPHWLYFTPLRKHRLEWSRVVIWTSAIATVTAMLGLVVGISMYSPRKKYRSAGAVTSFPYHGWKRWHAVLGLLFGCGAATWAFSGLLSMDPFPALAGSDLGRRPGDRIPLALHGRPTPSAFEAKSPQEALADLSDLKVKELELTSFAGEAVYIASVGRGDSRIVPVSGPPRAAFDRQTIIDIVKTAAEPAGLSDVRVLDDYDRYYLDRRHQRPLPVILARVNDPEQTRYYIDPRTARIVGTYSSARWVSRWLYHGLHSLDFPWLYAYRPLWDLVVMTFMVGGTALCGTSLILAWRVAGRTLAGWLSR